MTIIKDGQEESVYKQNQMLHTLTYKYPLLSKFKKPGKNMFWAWITYQVVKGTLTTTFVWAPLLYTWMH